MNRNVDPLEISKFESLAARWWDPESEFKSLHDINPLRLNFIERHADLTAKRVVDVGCGGGILSESMAKSGARVLGIDLGEAPLAVARLHGIESDVRVDYRHCAVEELAEQMPGEFDVVTCMEMLEHVPQPASVVAACARLAKTNGHVFFSTLNRNPKSWLMAVVGGEYFLGLLPKGTHEYGRFIKPSELAKWARQDGLEIEEMTGLHYDPISRRYHLGTGVDVNYLVHCVGD